MTALKIKLSKNEAYIKVLEEENNNLKSTSEYVFFQILNCNFKFKVYLIYYRTGRCNCQYASLKRRKTESFDDGTKEELQTSIEVNTSFGENDELNNAIQEPELYNLDTEEDEVISSTPFPIHKERNQARNAANSASPPLENRSFSTITSIKKKVSPKQIKRISTIKQPTDLNQTYLDNSAKKNVLKKEIRKQCATKAIKVNASTLVPNYYISPAKTIKKEPLNVEETLQSKIPIEKSPLKCIDNSDLSIRKKIPIKIIEENWLSKPVKTSPKIKTFTNKVSSYVHEAEEIKERSKLANEKKILTLTTPKKRLRQATLGSFISSDASQFRPTTILDVSCRNIIVLFTYFNWFFCSRMLLFLRLPF